MPQTVTERLTALESENARLAAEIAALKGDAAPQTEPAPPAAPQPTRHAEPRVMQTTILPSSGPMPSDDELRELQRIVGLAYPEIIPQPRFGTSEDSLFRDFKNAFHAVGKLGRTATLDTTRAVSWWVDYAESLVDRGLGQTGFASQFTAAVIASGDVPYRAWSPSSSVEFGLTWANAGTPAAGAWRGVLARRKVNPPAEAAREPRNVRAGDAMRAGYGR